MHPHPAGETSKLKQHEPEPQQVFVVHTTSGPARTWVFHSREAAVRHSERLATNPHAPRTTLTAGPLNPPPPPDPRTQVHLHWDGRILSTQQAATAQPPSLEGTLTLNPKHRDSDSAPWVIYHTANGDTQAGRDAAAMVAELKSLDLWPHYEHDLFSLMQHSGNHLPVWLTRVPIREEPDTGQIPGLLNGLIICHTCNALMNHYQDDQGRYYKCPTTVLDPGKCRNSHKDAPRLEWLATNRVTLHAQAVLTFLELALSAEQTDDPANQLEMNRALANSEIDELRETLHNAGPAHTPDLVQQTQQEADVLLPTMQRTAAEGSSPGQAIWDITEPRGPISSTRLRIHAARALTANLTQANIDLVRQYVVCIDPERENTTLRRHPHLSAGHSGQIE